MSEPKGTSGGFTAGESSRASPKLVTAGDRQLLIVELRPGETTYVSWKKLMKEASKVNGTSASVPDPPPNANPNLETRLAQGHPAEGEKADQPNRFSAVIEKIERLYMGKDSSGEELDSSPDDDEYDTEDSFIDDAELNEYFEVDNSAVKHDGFFVNRGKLERIEPSTTSNLQLKKRQRKESAKPCSDVADVLNKQVKVAKMAGEKDQSNASRQSSKKKSTDAKAAQAQDSLSSFRGPAVNASLSLEDAKYYEKANHQLKNAASHKAKDVGPSDALLQKYNNKSAHQQSSSVPGNSLQNVLAGAAVTKKEKNGMHEQANATGSRQLMQKAKPFSAQKKDSSNVRPKTSSLEKAIRELEKVVAESRPECQEADTSSQGVKRRLPREVKVKLGKVARIAAKEGKVSAELINRLMSIVGHLIQLRSLKRHLKIMIDGSMSANRERDDKFQRIKKEVIEMIKTQVPLMESQATEQQAGKSDDFQDAGFIEKAPQKKNFVMDAALEDKICDLYDIFVDGLDEDVGPQIRKLYVELAELWPNRLMDNHGIKRAICRAKERRRAAYEKIVTEANMKKRKQLGTVRPDPAAVVQQKHGGEKTSVDPSTTTNVPDSSHERSKQQNDKLKGSGNIEETKAVKRRTETRSEPEEYGPPPEKQLVLALTKQQPQLQVVSAPPRKPHAAAGLDLNLNQSS
ncbi:PREDICTED: ubinuclein-1-like isoform X4 [Tarenaya hassleriana]|uniref:ubinuclein-1-like isoform X3 n=1 Tax=Tarenaya hassleriana TaxID=28532 RepID=UPI00053C3211|nr:PREDICTED: ubinuclein-1-like isoform X3 [Tarenaya hassleriana]XP_010539682.1 PREDICTED: ubinuclein-1-like isoform X4 [Tarenaya hassleriana]